VIEGKGLEMVLTLGTGLGCALYLDGRYVPNLELAHHPFRKGKTYEDYVGARALHKVGKKKWNKRVGEAIDQLYHLFFYDRIYIGGGNAKEINIKLPKNAEVISNQDGILGGIKLWDRHMDELCNG